MAEGKSGKDDEFVPFDAVGAGGEGSGRAREAGIEKGLQVGEGEWCAEVEVNALGGGGVVDAEVSSETLEKGRAVEILSKDIHNDEADATSQATPNQPPVRRAKNTVGPSMLTPAKRLKTTSLERLENRQQRKQRRVEADAHNQLAPGGVPRADFNEPKEARAKDLQAKDIRSALKSQLREEGIRPTKTRSLPDTAPLLSSRALPLRPPTDTDTVFSKLSALEGPALPTKRLATPSSGPTFREKREARELADRNKPPRQHRRDSWQTQKNALAEKFGETGWAPRKRLSPDTLEGIRALHASDKETYSTENLAEHFKVTPEALRRILRTKWRPDEEEKEERKERWERRGVRKWSEMAEQGVRPPGKWRGLGAVKGEGLVGTGKKKRREGREREEGGLTWDEVVGGSEGEEMVERIL